MRRDDWPQTEGIQPTRGQSGGPMVKFEGYWIYLVPMDRWPSVTAPVGQAINACYLYGGFKSLADIFAADDATLLGVENLGPKRLSSLREWAHGYLAIEGDAWRSEAIAALDRVIGTGET